MMVYQWEMKSVMLEKMKGVQKIANKLKMAMYVLVKIQWFVFLSQTLIQLSKLLNLLQFPQLFLHL